MSSLKQTRAAMTVFMFQLFYTQGFFLLILRMQSGLLQICLYSNQEHRIILIVLCIESTKVCPTVMHINL